MDPAKRVCSSMNLRPSAWIMQAVDPARAAKALIGRLCRGHALDLRCSTTCMADRAGLRRITSGFQLENYNTYTGNITDTLANARGGSS